MEIKAKNFISYTALLTSIFAFVAFVIAVITSPITGPLCRSSCIGYPYNDIISRFPNDYYWMFFVIIFMIFYLILFACLQYVAKGDKKLFANIATIFATMATVIIISCYFVQISVIQPSLINGETAGIALMTQYNPHGVFIALEEIGYIIMGISFLFAALTFSKSNRLESAIRWVFMLGFALTMVIFILIASVMGLHREYIFEVIAIMITWVTLVINGALLAIFLRLTARNK